MEKRVISLVERVKISGNKGAINTLALIDTGAEKSSVDYSIAAKAGLGPITKVVKVKNKDNLGFARRAVAIGEVELAGVKKKVEFTIADRSKMRFKVLIGRDVIAGSFLVDPSKSVEYADKRDKKN